MRTTRGRETLERKPAQIKAARILEMTAVQPITAQQVAEALPISLSLARRYTKILHERKELHIASWIRAAAGGPPNPQYAAGKGKDARKPKPLPKDVISRRAYLKRKTERPDDYDRLISMARVRARIRHGIKPDPLMAWIPKREQREAA